MEYVALLAGEGWTDTPACTHLVLARMAQVVNDRVPDDQRHRLVPLIGRLFGTAPTGTDHEQRVLSVRLSVWCGWQSLPLVRSEDREVCVTALETAEAWCEGRATKEQCRAASVAASVAASDAAYASDAVYVAAHAANATAYYAAHATAYYAVTASAYAAAAAYADADLIGLLTGLLDQYDTLTGRTSHRDVTPDDLRHLATHVAGGAA